MMKSDGNGSYIIQKGTFALVMLLIALLSSVATVVAYGVTIKSDVNYLKESVNRASIDNPIYQDKVNQKLNQHDISIIVNQEKMLDMHNDIAEIKSDIKELLLR